MKAYEFSRFYDPRRGRFIFKHKGTGVIVDNIFKPMKTVASALFKKFAKPVAKKALEAGISHSGERLGKKISEKSGDMIMKKLANMRIGKKASVSFAPLPSRSTPVGRSAPSKTEESSDDILNRLISGSGLRRSRK